MIKKIVSGGQTGADRAALDAAISLEIPHGGWCPKGRLAELGQTIPLDYLLTETNSSDYSERTILNIRDSDATLIFVPSLPLKVTDGTVLTIKEVHEKAKKYFIVDLSQDIELQVIHKWIDENNIEVLNVAGPRESQYPGIYEKSLTILKGLFLLFTQDSECRSVYKKR